MKATSNTFKDLSSLNAHLPSIDRLPRKKKVNLTNSGHAGVLSARLNNRFYSQKKFKPMTRAYDEEAHKSFLDNRV